MISQQDKESVALSSLYDISDYTSYIDRRIQKLDLLYKRMSTDKTVARQLGSKIRMRNSQLPKMRLYQTLQEQFRPSKKETPSSIQTSYNTQYPPRRNRYSSTFSPLNSLQFSSEKSNMYAHSLQLKSEMEVLKKRNFRSKQQKLKDYQKIKQDMLGSFYVGGNKIKNTRFQPQVYMRHSEWKESDIKFRKGRLWHGRPPVKIIEKFE